jgi:hypothetical protein
MEDVVGAEVVESSGELVDDRFMLALGERVYGTGVEEAENQTVAEDALGGNVGRRPPGEDLDGVPEGGEGSRLVEDDDVHAAGVTGSGVVRRRRVKRDEGDVQRRRRGVGRRCAAGQRQRVVMRKPMKAIPKPMRMFQEPAVGMGRTPFET